MRVNVTCKHVGVRHEAAALDLSFVADLGQHV
jgi:hypothetical protein